MTDVPPPPRPADEPGDERPRPSDAPTEQVDVAGTGTDDTTSVHAGGLPTSGEVYPGPPPGGDWTPVAPRGGRLRRLGQRARGSRVALAIVALVVAAGLALGGFALAGGGHDGPNAKGERDGRGAASQRDDNNRDRANTGNGNGNGNGSRDGSGRGGRDRGDGGRGNNNDAQNGNGNTTTGTRQQVLGAVTAISSSSITVRTAGGSPSYALTAATPVTRGGSAASVADIKVGDAVLLHLVIASAGAPPVVERIAG